MSFSRDVSPLAIPALKACGLRVDEDARCLHLARYPGDESSAAFPLREIMVDATEHRRAACVRAPTNPRGPPPPRHSDCRATGCLARAAETLHCPVLDHPVFAGAERTSLRAIGLL